MKPLTHQSELTASEQKIVQWLFLKLQILSQAKSEPQVLHQTYGLHPVPSPGSDLEPGVGLALASGLGGDVGVVEPDRGLEVEDQRDGDDASGDSSKEANLVRQLVQPQHRLKEAGRDRGVGQQY